MRTRAVLAGAVLTLVAMASLMTACATDNSARVAAPETTAPPAQTPPVENPVPTSAPVENTYTPSPPPYVPPPLPDFPAVLADLAVEIGCTDWVAADKDTPHARAWGTCEFDGSRVRLYAFGWHEQESFLRVAPALGINPDLTVDAVLSVDLDISGVPDDLSVFNDLQTALTKASMARLQAGS